MPSDLKELLERAADRPSTEPDFSALARTGRRRRYQQRAVSGLAIVAVLALTSTVVLPALRRPEVAFDTGPRGGVGSWEAVPPAPIATRADAMTATDGRRVVVFGGMATDDPRGDVVLKDGAVYDIAERTWTVIAPPPFAGSAGDDGEVDGPADLQLLDDGRLLLVYEDPAIAGFYDFGVQAWESTGPAPVSLMDVEIALWTGGHFIMWGQSYTSGTSDGAVWTPNGWQRMGESPLEARSATASAWTGERLLVWGGVSTDWQEGRSDRVFSDGASYDPVADSWTRLPDSPLTARQAPDARWTGAEMIVMGGGGASRRTPAAGEATESSVQTNEDCAGMTCTGTAGVTGYAEEVIDGKNFVDGARFDPASGTWTPVPLPPEGARTYLTLRGEMFEAYGKDAWARYDSRSNTWDKRPPYDSPFDFDATINVGDRAVQVNTTRDTHMRATNRPRRIGGLVYNERAERWDPLTEADTSQRWGAVVTPVGDNRYFVWGGVSVTQDISKGYSGGEGVWRYHDDGAVLTLD